MGIWSRAKQGFADWAVKTSSLGSSTLALLNSIYGGRESKSGQSITTQTALEVTTALACARVLAEGVAQVPLKLFKERAAGGRDPAVDHPLYNLLFRRPNDWQTSFEFRETMMLHLVLCGNFLVYKSLVRGKIAELIPIMPGHWTVKQENDFTLTYKIRAPNGGAEQQIPRELVWHLRGPSWNTYSGLEAVRLAREALGLSLALEEHHARMHKNGVAPSGMYSIEGSLNEADHARLTQWVKTMFAGSYNAGEPIVVDRSAKWVPFDPKGVDTQHLETRRYQVEEVCRALRVMPIMVGHSDKSATYASAEQMFLAHVVHSLLPWGSRIEQSIEVNLLDADKDEGISAKFNFNALMRGAFKDRIEGYARALGSGGSTPWAEVNEIRDLEEWNPVSWGNGKPEPPVAVKPEKSEDDKPEPKPGVENE